MTDTLRHSGDVHPASPHTVLRDDLYQYPSSNRSCLSTNCRCCCFSIAQAGIPQHRQYSAAARQQNKAAAATHTRHLPNSITPPAHPAAATRLLTPPRRATAGCGAAPAPHSSHSPPRSPAQTQPQRPCRCRCTWTPHQSVPRRPVGPSRAAAWLSCALRWLPGGVQGRWRLRWGSPSQEKQKKERKKGKRQPMLM